jgi:hypothetical protein
MRSKSVVVALGITTSLTLGLLGPLGTGVAFANGRSGAGHGGGGSSGPASTHGRQDGHGGGQTNPSGLNTVGTSSVGDTTESNKPPISGPVGRPAGKRSATSILGSTTCSFHGKVTFSPPLKTGGTASSTLTITGLLRGCSSPGHGTPRFNNGHVSSLVGTLSVNDCAALSSGSVPTLDGGSITWTPPSKIAKSTGLSFPAGTGSLVSNGSKSLVQVSYSGGSIANGSFASGTTSMTITSDQDTTQLQARCVNGLSSVAVRGSATL